jgi:hypothetical protein
MELFMKNYANEQTIGATNMCSHTIMHVRLKRKLSFQHGICFYLAQRGSRKTKLKMLLNSCSLALSISYDRGRRWP